MTRRSAQASSTVTSSLTLSDAGSADVIDHYIRELQASPVLSGEQQLALARRMRRGDAIAREQLIRGNLRFVFSVAKQYQNRGLPLADLISEGNVGLCRAADKYDPELGVKFISYAVWWIKQSIFAALANAGRAVRVPLNRSTDLRRVQQAREILRNTLRREPTIEQIATTCCLHPDIVDGLLLLQQPVRSLDEPINRNGTDVTLSNVISATLPDDVEGDFEPELERQLRLEDIEAAIDTLPPREALILRLYYGIRTGEAQTLEAIGRRLGVTRERVRQLRDRALARLKNGAGRDLLRVYAA